MNKYYIIEENQLDLCDHNEVVENQETARLLPTGQYVIKTKIGTPMCEHFEPLTSYTNKEILVELAKPIYQTEEE